MSVRSNRQRGVAIISVLLTVALATIIVSGLFLREHITVRSVQNRVDLTQARWVERAAIDWSKVILAADAKQSEVDYLGEPWAVPVLDTRLDETVTAGAKIDDDARAATLSGQMVDAQSRFNLNSLVTTDDKTGVSLVSEVNLGVFKRLLDVLDLPESIADALAARILRSKPATGDDEDTPIADLPMIRVHDLMALRGVNADAIEGMRPFVVFLPNPKTKINVNTAPAEVLAAAVKALDLASAQRIVTNRERLHYLKLDEFYKDAGSSANSEDDAELAVGSDWFLVHGLIRFGRVESLTETLLRRNDRQVDVIWQRRL